MTLRMSQMQGFNVANGGVPGPGAVDDGTGVLVGGGPVSPAVWYNTGWLSQAYSYLDLTPDQVIAQVGSNGLDSSGLGITLDGATPFGGSSTVKNRWTTPGYGGAGIPVAIATTSWRFEFFMKFTGGVDNTNTLIYIAPGGSGAGSLHLTWYWGFSGISSVMAGSWTTYTGSGGGGLNNTMTRPNTTDWYHTAVQCDHYSNILAIFFGGRYVWGTGGGGTHPWAGAMDRLYVEFCSGTVHNHGGACLRMNLPRSKLYSYPAINDVAYTAPTSRLSARF